MLYFYKGPDTSIICHRYYLGLQILLLLFSVIGWLFRTFWYFEAQKLISGVRHSDGIWHSDGI